MCHLPDGGAQGLPNTPRDATAWIFSWHTESMLFPQSICCCRCLWDPCVIHDTFPLCDCQQYFFLPQWSVAGSFDLPQLVQSHTLEALRKIVRHRLPATCTRICQQHIQHCINLPLAHFYKSSFPSTVLKWTVKNICCPCVHGVLHMLLSFKPISVWDICYWNLMHAAGITQLVMKWIMWNNNPYQGNIKKCVLALDSRHAQFSDL